MGPGCSFLLTLRVVKFQVTQSCLYNKKVIPHSKLLSDSLVPQLLVVYCN